MSARGLTGNALLLLVTGWVIGVDNFSFFGNVLKTYGTAPAMLPALLSLVLAFAAVSVLLVAPFAFGRATKPVLIVLLLISALTAYFMDSYGVVINDEMLQNVVQTNPAEARDLITLRLLAYSSVLASCRPGWSAGCASSGAAGVSNSWHGSSCSV